MADKKSKTSKDLSGLRTRLAKSNLAQKDTAILDEILVSYIEAFKAIEKAKPSGSGKKLIAKLPFGFDIVK